MKITKFGHSCLLVEIPAPVNRTVLFDPGVYSTLNVSKLQYLDDIVITHQHTDHMDVALITRLRDKFPHVRIIAPADAVPVLAKADITDVQTDAPEGMRFFSAPHEKIRPYFPSDPPEEIGVHYLDMFSNPGDSHSFHETMPILALPVQAPWGSTVRATEVALELKPKYVIPVHDWHWSVEARKQAYDNLEQRFASEGITFIKTVDGQSFVIDLDK